MQAEVADCRATGVVFDAAPAAAHPSTSTDAVHVTGASGILGLLPDTAYFWTEEWQQGEREADEDIRAGRLRRFNTSAEALEYLRGL